MSKALSHKQAPGTDLSALHFSFLKYTIALTVCKINNPKDKDTRFTHPLTVGYGQEPKFQIIRRDSGAVYNCFAILVSTPIILFLLVPK